MTTDGAAGLSRDLLWQAVEGMTRPMTVLDEELRYRYVNAAAARLLGHTPAELVGRVLWEVFPPAATGPFRALYERVAAEGGSGSAEAWSDALGRWVRADVFRTDAGLVVTFDDVTARRRLEDERAAAVAARETAAGEAARAAAAAELAGHHLMVLGDVSHAMTSTLDVDEAVDRLAHLVVPLLADWCLVSVVDEDGTRRDVGRAHRDPAMEPAMQRYADLRVRSNRPSAPVPTALRRGEPVVIQHLTEDDVEAMVGDPESREALRPLRVSAAATFPLRARGELFGAFTLVNDVDRGPFTDAELRTAEIAALRAALALDNGRLHRATARVSERLQRSLLSPPPQPDLLELEVRYRPATRDIAIGGDWYDAFLQPDGGTVLVIGDVMGHDVEAAAAMGQLKTLVRAIAYDSGGGPAAALRRVDHAVAGLGPQALATALVARVEATEGGRRLTWASAGHPEPLLLHPGGGSSDLGAPVGPPLGLGWEGERLEGAVPLEPGSTLLLFTDGLFERRGEGLDDGRRRLADLATELAGLPLPELCDRLLAGLLPGPAEDDVALLAVRAHPGV